jgi:hypothetical protein
VEDPFVTLWTDRLAVSLLPSENVALLQAAPPSPDALPALPDDPDNGLSGWDWIGQLPRLGWVPVPVWGDQGWPLGNWPYHIFAHCHVPHRDLYGLATWVESDVYVEAFATREERDLATTHTALHSWESNENGPASLRSPGAAEQMMASGQVPPAYRVPYSG